MRKGSDLSHYRQAREESEMYPENPNFKAATFLFIKNFNTDGLGGNIIISATEDGGFATLWYNVASQIKAKVQTEAAKSRRR